MDDAAAGAGEPAGGGRALCALAVVLCAAAAAIAYANSLPNEFALDDAHTIEGNAWVRSLAHVPRYFADASTFSTLRTNVDYRPVLQTTYALDHALAGYDVRVWRATNLLIHVVVAASIFFLGRRLLGSRALAPLSALPPRDGDLASLAAALLFAVHPVGSGVVNYVSARSSSLVAALALPAVVLYLRALAAQPGRRALPLAGAWLLVVLALLTKVEAVSVVAVLALADVLLDPAKRVRGIPARLVDRATWLRIAPFVLAAAAYLILWRAQTGLADSGTRAGAGVTPWTYFLTQLRAWWYYVGLTAAPLGLVADYPSYPLSRSLAEPRVLLALGGWLAVVAVVLASVRRAPAVAFLLLSFFVWLAPHSSFVPLSEPVNEHRPYLALAGPFLLAAALGAALLQRLVRRPRVVLAVVVLAVVVPLVLLTRERNRAWANALTLWGDVVAKAPDSARGQMNYGLALMRRGRLADAEARFREALRLAPAYPFAHTNLAIVLAAQGHDDEARRTFDRAVAVAPSSDVPYYWRGRFRASRGELDAAADDFARAAERSAAPYREWVALHVVLEAAGRADEAAEWARRAQAVDPAGFAAERDGFRAGVLRAPAQPPARRDAVGIMNEGVALMRAGKLEDAETRFREALAAAPGYDRAHTNLGIVLAARGRVDEARAAHDRAVALGADGEALYWRGRFFVQRGALGPAADDFTAAVAARERAGADGAAGAPLRELAALAETLVRAGRAEDAASVVARGEADDGLAFARERAAFAAAVWPRR